MPLTTTRRDALRALCALGAPLLLPRRLLAAEATARPGWQGYRDALVIDALGGPDGSPDDPAGVLSQKALDHARASGVTVANLTVSEVGSYARDYDATIRAIAWWNAQVEAHPDRLLVVRSSADIDLAKRSGRLGLVYGFQDATPLGENLDRVALFEQLGVRIFQLTYNRRNLVGDGCLESSNAGLSGFGRDLVARLNERKLLIDLSHAGERTTLDAIAASKTPIAISHSGCAALNRNPRNKTDRELKALADRGGVVGIYFMPFLRERGQPHAVDLIAHIEHAIEVCGEDHVGLGSDTTLSPLELDAKTRKEHAEEVEKRRALGISAPGEEPDVYTYLPDLNTPDRFARLAGLLAQHGHSDGRIAKILGGNFNRLLREVWPAPPANAAIASEPRAGSFG